MSTSLSQSDRPSALPLRVSGGPTGILMCHGFTGSPASLRPWADRLIAAGHTVHLPLLPGHGTRWQDLNRTTFDDWFGCVQSELGELLSRCQEVFVAGLSMGGTLALRLAQTHPEAVAGLILVNPSVMTTRRDMTLLPLLKKVLPSLKGIAEDIRKPGVAEVAYPRLPLRALDTLRRAWPVVRADIGKVTMPVLLAHSAVDHVVEPANSAWLREHLSSTDITDLLLENSFHVATVDHDAELIFDAADTFISRVSTVAV